jgi:hypothetical protein
LSNERREVNNVIGRKRTVAVFCFNASWHHLHEERDENYETLLSRQPTSGPRITRGQEEPTNKNPIYSLLS